jgi:hypothetical protein
MGPKSYDDYPYKREKRGWEYNSVEEHLPSMCKALGLISSTAKKRRKEKWKDNLRRWKGDTEG